MRSTLGWMIGAIVIGGCVADPYLVPERGAWVAARSPDVAFADAAGVRVLVNGDAWRGDPLNLPELMTPLLVTIENHGTKRVRVAYSDFSLVGSSGFRYPALAPISGEPAVSQLQPQSRATLTLVDYHRAAPTRSIAPRFYHHRFYIAPHYLYRYPGFTRWSFAFPYDPNYYNRYYGSWPRPLPTEDMLAEALPEGVVGDDGRVSGFLYFPRVSRESRVRFEMKMVNADDGADLEVINIPFAVHH